MSERRGLSFRTYILLAAIAAGVIVGSYLQCGGLGLGPGFGFGKGAGSGTASAPTATATTTGAAPAPCKIRLDGSGLSVDGKPATASEAAAACRASGTADLVVTGDARSGTYDELRAALDAAGVKYNRPNAATTGTAEAGAPPPDGGP
jgi:hypothetical protein